ncbi:MAG: hypothetical protein ICV84_15600 [Flavisolibacter sp.]|nr:hypothetical protein [Flavisolibacter sp.]
MILLISATFFGSAIGWNTNSKAGLTIKLSAEKDTVVYPDPIQLKLAVKNSDSEVLYIPKPFSVVSNLYPNGIYKTEDNGARIRFRIEPVSKWLAVHVENISSSQPMDFIRIRKAATAEFAFDIEPHLKQFIKTDLPDTMSIALNKTYQIRVRYFNRWRSQKNPEQTFLGEVESNPITIYIKKK